MRRAPLGVRTVAATGVPLAVEMLVDMLSAEQLADRTTIIEVLLRCFAAVDDKKLDQDGAMATFTNEGQYVRPNGVAIEGPAEILTSQVASFARFRITHHG